MAPPGRAANGLMIYIHSTVGIDIDIELTKAYFTLILFVYVQWSMLGCIKALF